MVSICEQPPIPLLRGGGPFGWGVLRSRSLKAGVRFQSLSLNQPSPYPYPHAHPTPCGHFSAACNFVIVVKISNITSAGDCVALIVWTKSGP